MKDQSSDPNFDEFLGNGGGARETQRKTGIGEGIPLFPNRGVKNGDGKSEEQRGKAESAGVSFPLVSVFGNRE